MSRIDDLIDELCPDGVEFRSMSSIGTFIRGQRFVKEDMRSEGQPCIHYGEVYTKYQLEASTAISFLEPAQATRLRKAQPGDVVIAAAGETIEDIGKPVVWRGNGDVVIHDALYAFKSPLDPKFVAYFLRTDEFKAQARRLISSSKISAISIANFGKINIPIPPLEVQREIVSILDKFTQLEAELEAELEARRIQYEVTRDRLFDFSGDLGGHLIESRFNALSFADVSYRAIGSFAACTAGATPASGVAEYWENGTIPWMSSGEVNRRIITHTEKAITQKGFDSCSTKMISADSVVMALAGQGKTRGLVAITRIELCTNQSLCAMTCDESVIPDYLFHFLSSRYLDLRSVSAGEGGRGGLNLQIIRNYQVPIPPLEIQREIVSILDKLETLVNDITIGLPGEIAARRKQYEYYRNKLLTFKELEAA